MLTVSELYIYPIKSLGGIAVEKAIVTSRGLQYDRRLMLVDAKNRCLTQREVPEMALLQPAITEDGLHIHHKTNSIAPLLVPHLPAGDDRITVTIWDDTCEGLLYDNNVHAWFSAMLNMDCRLVYMPDTTNREVDKRYASNNEVASFADAYPMMMIGQSSLNDLNARLYEPLPMNRFRPNIVFTGGEPFLEDRMEEFIINRIVFNGVKLCARCVMTTINQDNISKSKEPLRTLATYRSKDNKILFGQNLLHKGEGTISIGDTIEIAKQACSAVD